MTNPLFTEDLGDRVASRHTVKKPERFAEVALAGRVCTDHHGEVSDLERRIAKTFELLEMQAPEMLAVAG